MASKKGNRIITVMIQLIILILIVQGAGCRLKGASPQARHGAKMIYDPVGNQVLLFGGRGNGGITGDLYADLWALDLDTQRWKEIEVASGPTPRLSPGMVYDPIHHQVILFGGYSTRGRVNDTWLFDLNRSEWQEIIPAQEPPARSDMGMAYDEINLVAVLFGGYCLENQRDSCSDTWGFDPAAQSWIEMNPESSPPVMYGHTMDFDPQNGQFLLFGGHMSDFSQDGMSSAGYNDSIWSYSYSDNQWVEIPAGPQSHPSARYWHQAAYDSGYPGLFVFGGDIGNIYRADTWFFDSETASWNRQRTELAPPARIVGSAVYSPDYDQVILFGGLDDDFSNLDDTWIYTGISGEWEMVSP